MAHLIDKSAVVAEIKRRIKEIDEIGTYLSPKGTLTNLLCFLNTLEIKEIDLEKEVEKYLLTNAAFLIGGDSKLVVHHIAKHFFELGLLKNNYDTRR